VSATAELDPVTAAIEAQRRRILELRAELRAARERGADYWEIRRLEKRLDRAEYFGD
jgi:hypothetical protein